MQIMFHQKPFYWSLMEETEEMEETHVYMFVVIVGEQEEAKALDLD